MQHLKSVVCGCLAVLVIGNKAAAEVRRENFRREKMLPGETRLAGPRGTNKSNNSEFWNRQFHVNLKILSLLSSGAESESAAHSMPRYRWVVQATLTQGLPAQ